MPPIHIGDSTHHHDQVITPVSLSTMGVTTTIGDSTPWAMFQHRSAVVCGSFTLMLNTLPGYGAGLAVCYSGMRPDLRGEPVPGGRPNADPSEANAVSASPQRAQPPASCCSWAGSHQ